LNPRRDDEIPDEIVFAEGLVGAPGARRFRRGVVSGSGLARWRCTDIEGLVLPVCDPKLADPAYAPPLGPRVRAALGAAPDEPLVVVSVAARGASGLHCNLRAPIVVAPRRGSAVQLILEDRSLPLRAPLAGASRGARC
jgi:flagellar assembly factor FliW